MLCLDVELPSAFLVFLMINILKSTEIVRLKCKARNFMNFCQFVAP